MQPKTIQDILLPILEIIGYTNDKEEFVKKFTLLCIEKTFAETLTSLPESNRKQLLAEIDRKTPEEIGKIVGRYINPQIYTNTLGKTMGNLIHDYLQTILPQCSEQQKQQIQTHLAALDTSKTT